MSRLLLHIRQTDIVARDPRFRAVRNFDREVERVRRSRVKAFGTIGLIFKRRFLQGLKRTFDRDAEKGVDGEVRFYYGNLARNTAHTREQIRVGIRGTMHVARARHVINIRHRNFRLNSVNRRVFFSVIRDYYSCYLKLRVEQ